MIDDEALADDDLDGDPFVDGAARTPVHVVGRVIARSPVGAWWCAFIDKWASPGRAERGQAYVRAGALVDLKVRPGCITAELDGAVRLRPMWSRNCSSARSAWRGGAATRQVPPRGRDGLAGPAVAVFAEPEK
jgi:hypothetical protein